MGRRLVAPAAESQTVSEQSFSGHAAHRHRKGDLLEGLVAGLYEAMEHALYSESLARGNGLLQRLDPRVKLVGMLLLILTAVGTHSLFVLLGLLMLACTLAIASRVPIGAVMLRVWLSVMLFTGLLALPAIVLVPGDAVYQLPLVDLTVTWQGLTSAGFLVGRSLSSASFAILLILCTPWPHVLKALRILRVPAIFVVILGMTYRYIFLFLKTARAMFEARRSRAVGVLGRRETRRLASASAGVLMSKSIQLSSDVYLAMISRGYRGEDFTLHDFRMRWLDWAVLAFLTAAAVLAFGMG